MYVKQCAIALYLSKGICRVEEDFFSGFLLRLVA